MGTELLAETRVQLPEMDSASPSCTVDPQAFRPVMPLNTSEPVAVLDNYFAPTLAFLCSLGARGIPLHVYGPRSAGTARFSRYCARWEDSPPLQDADRFIPWLRDKVRSGEIRRVAPTTDLIAFYLSEVRDEFAPEVRRTILPREALETCLLKTRFTEACMRLGQPVPDTFAPDSVASAVEAGRTLGYPLVLKPKSHLGVGLWERGRIVRTEEELRASFRSYAIYGGQKEVSERYPELYYPLLQRYVASAKHAVYSISGYKDPDHGVVAASLSCKLEQWPPGLGVSTTQVSCQDERILQAGIDAVDRLIPCGIFELELLADGERLLAIDLNPRAFGFIALDMALGNDLPWLWYESTFHPVGKQPAAKPLAIECRFTLPYYFSRGIGLFYGARKPNVDATRRRAIPMVGQWKDPLPMLISVARLLRHPTSLIRPYLVKTPDPSLESATPHLPKT